MPYPDKNIKKKTEASLRTHTCNALRVEDIGDTVSLIGWVQSKRNFGGILFIDLRDYYGLTQLVISPEKDFFQTASELRLESVIKISGKVIKRQGQENKKIATGSIEIEVSLFHVESESQILPFPIFNNPKKESEETRLKYRFLDLRTDKMQRNILFRSKIINFLRKKMNEFDFLEIQTPILTASSPEGARDFLVPSRLHPGQFFALPQAPQQFKQLLMCSGFDKYFQIAPCFRDEDPRSDRAPGDFYQLDIEMSFVTQDDIFTLVEDIMNCIFNNEDFSQKRILEKNNYPEIFLRSNRKFPCMSYKKAMETYGTDKPDLRYDLKMTAVEDIFLETEISFLKSALQKNAVLRAIKIPNGSQKSRKFYDSLEGVAKEHGLSGLPWLSYLPQDEWKGSIAKILSNKEKEMLKEKLKLSLNDSLVFILGEKKEDTFKAGGFIRQEIAKKLEMIRDNVWSLLWIVDFPMFEHKENGHDLDFSHNPFSMPKQDIINKSIPALEITAYQYDLVCNGVEIASGAIRNHKPDIMKKVFEIAGYTETDLQERFGALWKAFHFGAPPHGGIAPGIDRIIMLLLDEENIREVIPFPLSQKATDPMMGAPSHISNEKLSELHLKMTKTEREKS